MSHEWSRRRLLSATALAASGAVVPTTARAASAAAVEPVQAGRAGAGQSDPPPDARWTRTYGSADRNQVEAVAETDGGRLVAAGFAGSGDTGEPWLFAVDRASGREQWARTLPREAADDTSFEPSDVAATGDGVAVFGSSVPDGQFELLRAAADGDVDWRRRYAPAVEGASLYGNSVEPVDDGFVLGGYRVSDGSSSGTAVVRKVDAEGTEQWRRTLFPDRVSVLAAVRAIEGGYLGLFWLQDASSSDSGRRPVRSALAAFDDSGSVAWSREYAAGDDQPNRTNRLAGFVPTDEGYLLAGKTVRGTLDTVTRGWVVVTDDAGAVRAERVVGSEPTVLNGVGGGDGRYYVAGRVAAGDGDSSSGWLARVGTDATVRWSAAATLNARNRFRDVLATADGGVAVAGTTGLDEEEAQRTGGQVALGWLAKLGGGPTSATATPTAEATPSPTPASTPTATPDSAVEATPTPTPDRTGDPAEPTTASGTGPGFTAVGALAGLGGLWWSGLGLDRFGPGDE